MILFPTIIWTLLLVDIVVYCFLLKIDFGEAESLKKPFEAREDEAINFELHFPLKFRCDVMYASVLVMKPQYWEHFIIKGKGFIPNHRILIFGYRLKLCYTSKFSGWKPSPS